MRRRHRAAWPLRGGGLLGRADLERTALAFAYALMTGERVFFKPSADPADRSPGEPRAERERSEGRRVL